MSEHALFSPSASERWISCPASFAASRQAPPELPSPYAALGALAHDWAAKCIIGNLNPMKCDIPELDDEMLNAIAVYVGIIRDLTKAEGFRRGLVETRLSYNADLFGTADYVALVGGTLHVIDFKSGRGITVKAKDNAQLMTYAWMALRGIRAERNMPTVTRVQLTIVQPLGSDGPTDFHTVTPEEVHAWGLTVVQAMQTATKEDAEFVAGEHCRFCRAKPVCPELRGIVVKTEKAIKHTDMTPADLGDWLAKADVLEQWLAGLREFAHAAATSGITIPGWKLIPKRASRKWVNESVVRGICTKQGIKAYEERLVSPPALEKALGEIPEVLVKHIVQESSGFNLVRDKSPRIDSGAPTLQAALTKLQYRV